MIEHAIMFATFDVKDDRKWCSARRWKLQFLTVSRTCWSNVRELSRTTPKTFSLSVVAIVLPATVTVSWKLWDALCIISMLMTVDTKVVDQSSYRSNVHRVQERIENRSLRYTKICLCRYGLWLNVLWGKTWSSSCSYPWYQTLPL